MLSLKTLLVFICLAAAGGGFYEASASSRYKVDDFLNPSARVKAMGASGAAMGECSSALAVNPAVTAYEPHGRVSLFYGNISGNTHLGYIEYNYPFSPSGSLGGAAEFRSRDSSNHTEIYRFGLSYSPLNFLNLGLSGKALLDTSAGDQGQDFSLDAGMHIAPLSWFNAGFVGYNLTNPEFEYEDLGKKDVLERSYRGGLSFFYKDYVSLTADMYIDDFEESFKESSPDIAYGIEIMLDPALAVRGGFREEKWSAGVGIVSGDMNFDYAYMDEEDRGLHFFQYTYKFGLTPSRKEKKLREKEEYVEREMAYLQAVRLFNLGRIAEAESKASEYVSRFKEEERIQKLMEDIQEWVDKKREEKLGRAKEIKDRILRFFHQGRIEQAKIELENAKLLAPNFEDLDYIEHLLRARTFLEEGDYLKSEEELIEALKINPDSRVVRALYERIQEVLRLSD